MIYKCPGQDKKNIEAKVFKCPKCGYEIEVFSDETKARCLKCRSVIYRETLPNCIDWCKYAADCVGRERYESYMKGKRDNRRV